MKKFISIITTIALIISMTVISTALEPENAELTVETKTASPGTTGITIALNITENPGLATASLDVTYDATRLVLTGSANGTVLNDYLFGNDFSANPYTLQWNNIVTENITATGTLAILTFNVRADAPLGDASISVTYTEGNVFDKDETLVDITITNGKITVAPTLKTLSYITVTTPPSKLKYIVGETFAVAGMTVMATYSDNTTANVTASCIFDPLTTAPLTTDNTSILISYTENGITKTTVQTITVEPPYDVNGDFAINVLDLVALKTMLSPDADIDGDGDTDDTDFALLSKYILES